MTVRTFAFLILGVQRAYTLYGGVRRHFIFRDIETKNRGNMATLAEIQCFTVVCMRSRNGPRLTYASVYEKLDDRKLYSLYMIRKFAASCGLLRPRSDDQEGVDVATLENRFRSALNRAVDSNYGGRRLPQPEAEILDGGRMAFAWFGATIKLFLADQLPSEQARLEKLRAKLNRQRQVKKRRPRSRRLWLVAAFIAATACGAPPVRDLIVTLYTEGLAAAKEQAYSRNPQTPHELYQQAWVDYRGGDYDQAARKVYQVLSEDPPAHLQASCWYLLGSVDWQTGNHFSALGQFQKAYSLSEMAGDSRRLYRIAVAISKVQTALGDLEPSASTLALAYEHFSNATEAHNLREYYLASAWLAAAHGNYLDALDFTILRHQEIVRLPEPPPDLLAGSLSDLGFWQAVASSINEAQAATIKASALIYQLQDETRHMYNQINWVLIQRIQSGTTDSHAVGNIQRWARIRNDSRAELYLNLALRIEPKEVNAGVHSKKRAPSEN